MTRVAVLIALALGALGACSKDAPAGPHSAGDVRFTREMIRLNQAAIDMAAMATERSRNRELRALAGAIGSARGREIETMRGWLNAWGEPGPEEASANESAELEAARPSDFDRRFVELMIQHHRDSQRLAERQLFEGEFREAVNLAGGIARSHRSEITKMEALLGQLP